MADNWKERLGAVSTAQARYLWVLVILGVFYFALQRSASRTVEVPILELPLPASAISLSGPAVLFFILLVILGAMRAYATAEAKATTRETPSEAIDTSPNAIDLAVYTTSASPKLLLRLLRGTYPLFLSVFAIEATWLLVSIFERPDRDFSIWLFRFLGVLTGVPAILLLLRFWWAVIRPPKAKSAA